MRGETPRRTTRIAAEAPLHEPAEPRAGRRQAHPDRAPAVPRGDVVVGVLDRREPRLRLRAQRRVLDALGPPAGGREEVRRHRCALVGDELAARRLRRRVGRRRLDARAAVDLRARVGIVLEAVTGARGRDRVGAGRDRLRVERLGRPRGRHLDGDHALHVLLELERVDGVDAAERAGAELERAAIGAVRAPVRGAAAQHERRRPGHAQRGRHRGQRAAARRPQRDAPAGARARVVGPRRRQLAPAAGVRARERGAAAHGLQQHAHVARRVQRPQRRAAVVVRQDPAVVPALRARRPSRRTGSSRRRARSRRRGS